MDEPGNKEDNSAIFSKIHKKTFKKIPKNFAKGRNKIETK